MDTKKVTYRVASGIICAFIGYLLYELSVEAFLSSGSTVIQICIAAVVTVLLLLVLIPLSRFFWRGDDKGILMVLIFIGSLTIAGLGFHAADSVRHHIESLPSLLRLVFSLISLGAPFYLSILFHQWASKKCRTRRCWQSATR